MTILVQTQARAGDRHHARENLKRLEEFVAAVVKTSRIGNADAAALPELALPRLPWLTLMAASPRLTDFEEAAPNMDPKSAMPEPDRSWEPSL